MPEIPTFEPKLIYTGDTVKWTKSLADYPSTTWTLTYNLRGDSDINIVAGASGTDHLVNVDEAVSALWTVGTYYYTGRVTDGTDVFTVVPQGILTIAPSLSTVTGTFDGRTHAKKMLDYVCAILEGRGADAQDIESYSIGTRSISRMSYAELLELKAHYQDIVNVEEDARLGRNRRLRYTRFVRV